MLNIDMPPVAMPSAVIVTTDSLAAATTLGRSASVMILAGTAFAVAAAAPVAAGAAAGWVASRMPTVEPDARTAARTLAPTTVRRPREESRRTGVVGTGDVAALEAGTAVQPAGVAGDALASGRPGSVDG